MTAPASELDPVGVVLDHWVERLTDLSRRNPLLYFRDLKKGTLELGPEALFGALLSDKRLKLNSLCPGAAWAEVEPKLKTIQRKARENFEERGLSTLGLIGGLVRWDSKDKGRAPCAPLCLLPVQIEGSGHALARGRLERAGDVALNPVLFAALKERFGLDLEPEALLPELSEEVEPGDPMELIARAEAALLAHGAEIPGLAVERRLVLANLSFQKLAMVRDLQGAAEAVAAHPIVGALAGLPEARQALQMEREAPDYKALDARDPSEEFLVFDADSSQQWAIEAVARGDSGVIQGPPGTGKSQTIANLLTTLVAAGKRVLFVAEKRAALEVVQRRLAGQGLEHLYLDLHGGSIPKRQLARALGDSLEQVGGSLPPRAEDLHHAYVETRDALNATAARLHRPQALTGDSVYTMAGQALALRAEGHRANTRLSRAAFSDLDLDAIREQLRALQPHSALVLDPSLSPWGRAPLTGQAEVEEALAVVSELARLSQKVEASFSALSAETGLPAPADLPQLAETQTLLEEAAACAEDGGEALLNSPRAELNLALAPARRGGLRRLFSWLFSPTYRAALRQARAISERLGGRPAAALGLLLARASALQERWAKLAGTPPKPAAQLPALAAFGPELTRLSAGMIERVDSDLNGLPALFAAAAACNARRSDAALMPKINGWRATLSQPALGGFQEELRPIPSEQWAAQLDSLWLESALELAWIEDPELAAFHRQSQEERVERFRMLDRQRRKLSTERVARAHAEACVAAMNEHPDQQDLIRREATKKTRHKPLRRLLTEAPELTLSLRPCWMASPLSVSQLLPLKAELFDVVIFDEASQVLPEDAIPALLRGQRGVVAGDSQQLPPTAFFALDREDEEEDEALESIQGYESLLDQFGAMISPWWLRWHYRSEDERLIAFSNHHIYEDHMVTFPSTSRRRALEHVFVDALGTEAEAQEVLVVVERVLEHARTQPERSLGVIAMGIKHAQRIQGALDRALAGEPTLQHFFREESEDAFFVKNLERVQGDERDVILLSVGYARADSGALPHRFGPLNQAGGERRLNVAITRARSQLILVSSFTHRHIDPRRSSARGVQLLRSYIEYVASGGNALGGDGEAKTPLNPFELDILQALRGRGIEVTPQWGVSSYRIDFVVHHPERPGELVLAIEADGAQYHSSHTARERDRLRQEHLERLGWRFHRIWSLDWFQRREEELERAVQAVEAAVLAADTPQALSPRLPSTAATPPATEQARGPLPFEIEAARADRYDREALAELVQWIESDGRLRSDEALIKELMTLLGYQRRSGARQRRLQEAIDAAHEAELDGVGSAQLQLCETSMFSLSMLTCVMVPWVT